MPSSSSRAAADGALNDDSPELSIKLTWLAVFRVSVTSVLLVFLGARRALAPPVRWTRPVAASTSAAIWPCATTARCRPVRSTKVAISEATYMLAMMA